MQFSTQVSGEHHGILHIRDWPLADLIAQHSFTGALFISITGREPTEQEVRILNAILVASLDHGISPASGFVPRVAASLGNDVTKSIVAGLAIMGPYHGGSTNEAADIILKVKDGGISYLQSNFLDQHRRIIGLGHPRFRLEDPRADQLLAISQEENLIQTHQDILRDMQKYVYEKTQKHLCINLDGAIAAILLDLGLPPLAGNGLFAMARAGGMIAHILEEYNEKPLRRVDESDVNFTPPGTHPGEYNTDIAEVAE